MRFASLNYAAASMIAAVSSLTMFSIAVHAAEVLDQQNVVVSSIADTPSDSQEFAQTFTAGSSGTLSRIEVYLARLSFASDSAVLTVYSTTGGVPNVALGNASVSATQISTTTPTFVSFDLNSFQIPVNANDVLAYSMMSSAGGLYIMPFESTNSYPGGSSYRRTLSVPPGPWQIQTDRDYGFKTYLLIDESAELFGDYNDDHVVNAADYTVWRNMLGTDGPLPHDFTPEVVDDDDYDYWKAHFGESSGGLGSSAAVQVPEPTTLILVGMAFGCRAMPPRTRKRRQNR